MVSNSFLEILRESPSMVRVSNVTKIFKKKIVAVDNIKFDLPKNRITVLLGHNGAGKTTTMQMITGFLPVTHGLISIDGEDNAENYRSVIGYCPQEDVFIDYMNCRDQLVFFGCLRGLSTLDANIQADRILHNVRMTDFAKQLAKTLSSGMKRRLSLACAVIGQTKVVILDEPSTGLDPDSRRLLWNIILDLRKHRTVLLTTHSMEEADVLGDKIIIMNQGKILCEGSQFDLKKEYGTGYTLKILTNENFDCNKTLNKIKEFIPTATLKLQVNQTMSVMLPYESVQYFEAMLSYLERTRCLYGISAISIANTTMEEVFLK